MKRADPRPAPPTQTGSPRAFLRFFVAYAAVAIVWLGFAAWTAFRSGPPVAIGKSNVDVPSIRATAALAAKFLFSAVDLAIGLYLFCRYSQNWTARFLAVGMVGTAAAYNANAVDVVAHWSASFGGILAVGEQAFVATAVGAYVLGLSGVVLPLSRQRTSLKSSTSPLGWTLAALMAAVALLTLWAGVAGVAAPVLGTGLLISGVLLQGHRAIRADPSEGEGPWARVFVAVMGIAFLFSVVGALAFLGLEGQQLDLSKLLDSHFALLVLPPLLTGLPLALLLGDLKGKEKLGSSLEHVMLFGTLTVVSVAAHMGMEFVVKHRAFPEMNIAPDGFLASAFATWVVVSACDQMRESVSSRLKAWIDHGLLRLWGRHEGLQRADRLPLWAHDEDLERDSLLPLSRDLIEARDAGELLEVLARYSGQITGAEAARASMRTEIGTFCRWWGQADEGALRLTVPIRHGSVHLGEIAVTDRMRKLPVPGKHDRRRRISYESIRRLQDLVAVAALAFEAYATRGPADPELDHCQPRPSKRTASSGGSSPRLHREAEAGASALLTRGRVARESANR